MSKLTQTSPQKSKQQSEENIGPVPLMFCCYGNNTQEEEDEGLRDGAQHLDHVSDGCAGTLGNILLNIVLHGESTANDAAGTHQSCLVMPFSLSYIEQSAILILLTPWWTRWQTVQTTDTPGSWTWIRRGARSLGPWKWTSSWRRPQNQTGCRRPFHRARPQRTRPRPRTHPQAPPLACLPQSWTCCTTPGNKKHLFF